MKRPDSIVRGTLLLQAVLLFSSFANAQGKMSDHIQADTLIPLPHETTTTHTQIIHARHGRTVLFTCYSAQKNKDTITLYRIHIDSLSCKELRLYLPGIGRYLQEHRLHNIEQVAFDERRVFLAFHDQLLQCRYGIDGLLTVDWQTQVDPHFNEMFLLDGNTLVFSRCYPSVYEGMPPVTLFTYDIPTRKATQTIEPEYNTFLLSPFRPFKNVDVQAGSILWANRNEYSFTLYNSCLETTSLAKVEESDFKGIPGKKLKRITRKNLSGMDLIEEMRPLIFLYDRVDFAYLVDDSNVAIVRCPKVEQHSLTKNRLDWWRREEGQWRQVAHGIEDFAYNEVPFSDPVDRNHLQIGWLMGRTVVMFDDKIVSISKDGVPTSPIGISRKEYVEERNRWLLENDTHIEIYIISHNFAK